MAKKKAAKKKSPTYFQERKDFIARMISKGVKIPYAREQKLAKDLFNKYPVKFLNVVPKPFELNSIAWFLSYDGEIYLNKELKRFLYQPKEKKAVKYLKKEGEPYNKKTIKQFRDFLNE